MPFCQNCGAQLNEGASFCNNCGVRVGAGPAQPEQPPFQPQYQQQYYQPQYQQPVTRMGGGYRCNIRKREAGMAILLSIVTCGIYGLIWFFNLVADLNTADPGPNDKDPGVVLLLSIFTCGIYGLIWFFGLVNDLNTADPGPNDKEPIMVLLLGLVTCGIYSWIWVYNAGQKVDNIRQRNGEAPSGSSTTYLLLSIFGLGIVVYYLIQTELNKVAMDA